MRNHEKMVLDIQGNRMISAPVTDSFIASLADAVAKRVYERLRTDAANDQIVLNGKQVGGMIGRTERAVMQMYHANQIPGFKIGNKIAFDRRKILQWIESLQ
jgi:hypothetical protein